MHIRILTILTIIPLLSGCSDPQVEADQPAPGEPTCQDFFGIRDFLVHDTLYAADTGALFSVDTMRALVKWPSSGYQPSEEDLEYRFPIVRSSQRPEVARKITQGIWDEVYGFEDEDSTVFEGNVLEEGESGQTYLDFSVLDQTPRLLVIKIMQEGCGAYCTYWESIYLYDLNTGKRVFLSDLVTQKGLEWLARESYERARMRIVDYISSLQSGAEQMDSADIVERIEFYTDCLESSYDSFDPGESAALMVEGWGGGLNYSVVNDSLFLPRPDCSKHVNRALADLGNLESVYAISDIFPYLSAYGKEILGR